MRSEFLEILRASKPKNTDIVEHVFSISDDKLLDLAIDLSLAIRPGNARKDKTKHSFIANSALSGGGFPCHSVDCREQKLNELASFATLYSDRVFIQDPFEKILLREPSSLTDSDRKNIMFGIFTYQKLYPLIERDIVKFAQSTVSLCQHHFDTTAKDLHQKQLSTEDKIYKGLKDAFIAQCQFEVNITKGSKQPFIKVTGPENLVEHGISYLHLNGNCNDNIQYILNSESLPYIMKDTEIYFTNIIERWMKPVIDDLFYQKWHATFYDTKLLTDNNTQIDIATSSINSENYTRSASLYSNFQHFMPTVMNRPLDEIIEFRIKETESFLVYRDKLDSLIKNSYGWSHTQIREMFEDELMPEINQINYKVKNWKSDLRVSSNEKLLLGFGTVAVGLVSGILPENITEIIAAVGGYSALESYNKSLKPDNEAKNNDLYFLWKMNK